MTILRTSQILWLAAVACLTVVVVAEGQVAEQSFPLRAGWNAVYLEIDPQPDEADELFDGLPVTAVWVYENPARAVYVGDCSGGEEGEDGEEGWTGADAEAGVEGDTPACLRLTDNGWRVWYPPDSDHRVITTLRVIRGGRVYLVEATDAATLTVAGTPNASRTRWRRGFNLVGFHVTDDAEAAPTFARYLGPSSAHDGAEVYAVQADGTLAVVDDTGNSQIVPGQGYWVSSSRDTDYDGPVRIDGLTLGGISLTNGIVEHSIRVENMAGDDTRVTVSPAWAAWMRAAGEFGEFDGPPDMSGSAPLMWLKYNAGGGDGDGAADTDSEDVVPFRWQPLDAAAEWLLSPAGDSGSSRSVRLAADYATLVDATTRSDGESLTGVLELRDDQGYRRWLGYEIDGPDDWNGLWIGTVTINAVSFITSGEVRSPVPTSSEFSFRVILHKDGAEQYRMLTDATLVQQDDEWVICTPGSDCDCNALVSTTTPSPRVSTTAYWFVDDQGVPIDLDLAGSFEYELVPAAGPVTMPANDPLNPFFHKYHPDHGDGDGAAGGFAFTRDFTFVFDDFGGDPPLAPGWGLSMLTGTYHETIGGLFQMGDDLNEVEVSGWFELRLVSEVATLCAGG